MCVDKDIEAFLLQEFINEAKALGQANGSQSKSKLKQINIAQSATSFLKSMRAHSRAAAKQVDKKVLLFRKNLSGFINKFKNGNLSFSRLQTLSSAILQNSAEEMFRLGSKSVGLVGAEGSPKKLTNFENSWLKSYLRDETRFLFKFLRDIKSGASSKTTAKRVVNYSNALRSVYETGRVFSVGNDVIIHWVLESKNPCPDCRLLHRYSPYVVETLPTVPKQGITRCRAYCYCSLKIVKSLKKDVLKVRQKSRSAKWILDQIKKNQKTKRK